MATRVPHSVQQALGEQAALDLADWLEVFVSDRGVTRPEWIETQTRLGVMEHDLADLKTEVREMARTMNERFDAVNERFDTVNQRFDAVNQRFQGVSDRFDDRFAGVHERFDRQTEIFDARFDQLGERIDRQTRWSIGLLALFGSLITVLVGLGQFPL